MYIVNMGLNMNKSGLIRGALTIVVIVVASAFLLDSFSTTTTTPESKGSTIIEIDEHNQLLFHGDPDEPTGCAECHTEPITEGDCTTAGCHPSPPQELNQNVTFPHHDPTPGGPTDNCALNVCHDCSGDFRYVSVVTASHAYCQNCHLEYTHS